MNVLTKKSWQAPITKHIAMVRNNDSQTGQEKKEIQSQTLTVEKESSTPLLCDKASNDEDPMKTTQIPQSTGDANSSENIEEEVQVHGADGKQAKKKMEDILEDRISSYHSKLRRTTREATSRVPWYKRFPITSSKMEIDHPLVKKLLPDPDSNMSEYFQKKKDEKLKEKMDTMEESSMSSLKEKPSDDEEESKDCPSNKGQLEIPSQVSKGKSEKVGKTSVISLKKKVMDEEKELKYRHANKEQLETPPQVSRETAGTSPTSCLKKEERDKEGESNSRPEKKKMETPFQCFKGKMEMEKSSISPLKKKHMDEKIPPGPHVNIPEYRQTKQDVSLKGSLETEETSSVSPYKKKLIDQEREAKYRYERKGKFETRFKVEAAGTSSSFLEKKPRHEDIELKYRHERKGKLITPSQILKGKVQTSGKYSIGSHIKKQRDEEVQLRYRHERKGKLITPSQILKGKVQKVEMSSSSSHKKNITEEEELKYHHEKKEKVETSSQDLKRKVEVGETSSSSSLKKKSANEEKELKYRPEKKDKLEASSQSLKEKIEIMETPSVSSIKEKQTDDKDAEKETKYHRAKKKTKKESETKEKPRKIKKEKKSKKKKRRRKCNVPGEEDAAGPNHEEKKTLRQQGLRRKCSEAEKAHTDVTKEKGEPIETKYRQLETGTQLPYQKCKTRGNPHLAKHDFTNKPPTCSIRKL